MDVGDEDIADTRQLVGKRDGFSSDQCPVDENRGVSREGFIKDGGITENFLYYNGLLVGFAVVLDKDRCMIGMNKQSIKGHECMPISILTAEWQRNGDTGIVRYCGCLILREKVSDMEQTVLSLMC